MILENPVNRLFYNTYNFRVLKEELIPILVENDTMKMVIKKGTNYMTISTDELLFVDITNYLAPGFNYSKFLAAYGAKEQKSYWPYEWFTKLSQLESSTFPQYDAFFSTLHNENTLEPRDGSGLSEQELQLIGRVPTKISPLTAAERVVIGRHRYTSVKTLFDESSWTIKEYLEHYNNLDTGPFIQALGNLVDYYASRGVDIFKESLSGQFKGNNISI